MATVTLNEQGISSYILKINMKIFPCRERETSEKKIQKERSLLQKAEKIAGYFE